MIPNEQHAVVTYGGKRVYYVVPNRQIEGRVRSIFSKEPVTIHWMSRLGPDAILADVGANVGMYSIWAAAVGGARVLAFEPEGQNYAVLNRNIAANDLAARVKGYPLAMSNRGGLSDLHLSHIEAGYSCHSLGAEVGHTLQPRPSPFAQGCVHTSLDALVHAGNIPAPTHMKVDVDGFEHLVIDGAADVLRSVRELIVEVNTNLAEHAAMVQRLETMGFHFDAEQVDEAIRRDGMFQGCAEFLFRRLSAVECHVLAKIATAEVRPDPYPHIYVEDVFPRAFYDELRGALPGLQYDEISKVRKVDYPERFVAAPPAMVAWMLAGTLRHAINRKFGTAGRRDETLLIRDIKGYALGPHSDANTKVVSCLFYLPVDASLEAHGTSMYAHKDPAFRCAGGPHYEFTDFSKVWTAPFRPNSLFAFAKSDRSFHGVEPFERDGVRDILLYDIRTK